MSIHRLTRQQQIPASLKDIWHFFSKPENLSVITPPYMKFRVTSSHLPDKIYTGLLITYKVSPLVRIPLTWVTEIMEVEDQKMFVDEQRKGPYKYWRHEHYFEENERGGKMTDIVQYRLPFGILGDIVHRLVVKSQLESIFNYRFKKVIELFGKP